MNTSRYREYNTREISEYLIQPDAGLGNRLYCLYSALYYWKQTGRPFNIIWLRENCCNVSFDELFDIQSIPFHTKIHKTWHLGYKNRYAVPTILSNAYMMAVKKINQYYTAEATRDVYTQLGEKGIEDIMQAKHVCIKANGVYFDVNNFEQVRNLLLPSQRIIQKVNDIMNPYTQGSDSNPGKQKGNVYGIHIRRTDNKRSIDNSPLEEFDRVMTELVKEKGDVVFYLATDDAEVEKDFKSRYNIIEHSTFGDSKSRDSSTGIMDAYVDMLCLSRCDVIYGSYGSSFSEMASLIGNKELEIVRR